MHHPSGGLCLTNQRCAQASDVHRSRIISGPIPATDGIGAAEPGAPLLDGVAMIRRPIGAGWLTTAGADVRGLPGLLPLQPHSSKKALVAQDAPQCSTDLHITDVCTGNYTRRARTWPLSMVYRAVRLDDSAKIRHKGRPLPLRGEGQPAGPDGGCAVPPRPATASLVLYLLGIHLAC